MYFIAVIPWAENEYAACHDSKKWVQTFPTAEILHSTDAGDLMSFRIIIFFKCI